MPKTDNNLQKSEKFIRDLLKSKFGQDVSDDKLRGAAEKLCDSIPAKKAA